jgi:hypothetical protein
MTTTHAGYGEGHPCLRVAMEDRDWSGEPQPVFDLDHEITTIGSGPDADIRLEGLAPLHAQVEHDDRDDYVLVLLAEGEAPASPDEDPTARPAPQVLHTGTTFRVGPWALSFEREGSADHGRPFGGRQGGEGSVQQSQPPRPDYTAEHQEAARREGVADER